MKNVLMISTVSLVFCFIVFQLIGCAEEVPVAENVRVIEPECPDYSKDFIKLKGRIVELKKQNRRLTEQLKEAARLSRHGRSHHHRSVVVTCPEPTECPTQEECNADEVTSQLNSCLTEKSNLEGLLDTCNNDLDECNADLATCNASCDEDSECQDDLEICQDELEDCEEDGDDGNNGGGNDDDHSDDSNPGQGNN